jgi:transcription elongation factor Elf1
MQFKCPLCEATGVIPEDKIEEDVTKWACANCGAMLFVNSETGQVDAHKSPFKDYSFTGRSGASDAAQSSGRPAEDARDWLAIGVFVGVLVVLAGAGVYLFINLGFI